MEQQFREMSLRGKLAFGVLLPLTLATGALAFAWAAIGEGPVAGQGFALLSGVLMCLAIGSGLVLHHINARFLLQPLEDGRRLARAMVQGQYGETVRIHRLDEAGRMLVALEELGDYLAMVLPEEAPRGQASRRSTQVAPQDTLERIAKHLRQSGEAFAPQPEAQRRPAAPGRVARPHGAAHLRIVARQA
jgi:hypothetical protein